MSLTLGPLFAEELRPFRGFGVKRPADAGEAFYVTNPFDGPDLINRNPDGSPKQHNAADVGNASTGYALLSPLSRPMRRLFHFDGAVGREWDLGNGWRLQAWHVAPEGGDPARVAGQTAAGPWGNTIRGQVVARTGRSGLGTGAHTHLALFNPDGDPVDPVPHLVIAGRPPKPIEGAIDDMARYRDEEDFGAHANDIEEAAVRGLMFGRGEDRFEPLMSLTRREAASLVVRADNRNEQRIAALRKELGGG